MYWRKRGAPERICINFEYELSKEYALEEDGGSREDLHQFWIGIEKEYVLGKE
jgi:hypothetical protein